MDKVVYDRKIQLINRMIDLYFEIDAADQSFETIYYFIEWLSNGDFEKEKDAALQRKFDEIYASEESTLSINKELKI